MEEIQKLREENEKLRTKLFFVNKELNRLGMLQMGALDYTEDFFEQAKVTIRQLLVILNK